MTPRGQHQRCVDWKRRRRNSLSMSHLTSERNCLLAAFPLNLNHLLQPKMWRSKFGADEPFYCLVKESEPGLYCYRCCNRIFCSSFVSILASRLKCCRRPPKLIVLWCRDPHPHVTAVSTHAVMSQRRASGSWANNSDGAQDVSGRRLFYSQQFVSLNPDWLGVQRNMRTLSLDASCQPGGSWDEWCEAAVCLSWWGD